jgi:hypothetical protein
MDTGGKIRTGKLLEKLNDLFKITLVSSVESPSIFLHDDFGDVPANMYAV